MSALVGVLLSVVTSAVCVVRAGKIPEYPLWFEPFVMLWMKMNDDNCDKFFKNSYERLVL